jgi:hypothetical protein
LFTPPTAWVVLAALGSTGACLLLWVIFAGLLAIGLRLQPPMWLIPVLMFSITVVLAAAVVVTFDASGYKIDDLVTVLDHLHIESPGSGDPSP